LILKGIRQVGKTWLLIEFGRSYYEDVAYFNFEGNAALAERFKLDLDPVRLLTELGVIHGKPILPGRTLIFFDEIQFCAEALTVLKYFCEQAREYHLVCAGSLLGIALSKPASFPVGKVDFMTLYPLTFQEFLLANGEDQLVSYLSQLETPEPLPKIFTNKLITYLKTYYMIGGMPEPVSVWLQT
jgi:predicted AAA+ superfamily ATPase